MCDELILSQVMRKGKIQKEVRIESTLREIRDEANTDKDLREEQFFEFKEDHVFHKVNNEPPKSHFDLPFFVQGGFANAMGFGHENRRDCFEYRISQIEERKTLKIDVSVKADRKEEPCRSIHNGYRQVVLFDPVVGHILHTERTISPDEARSRKQVYFAAMDYGPQELGGKTIWLPTKLVTHDEKDRGRMIVTYSNYHRYKATSTIVPVSSQPSN